MLFDREQWAVVDFCAEEVKRQYAHPYAPPGVAALAVSWMLKAWEYALLATGVQSAAEESVAPPTLDHVQELGYLVEPKINAVRGWRTESVVIGTRRAPQPDKVPDLMSAWARHLKRPKQMIDLAKEYVQVQRLGEGAEWMCDDFPAAAYFVFEHVHPFADGNGRTGKIVYNWLRGTLREPEFPPNFWRISNP